MEQEAKLAPGGSSAADRIKELEREIVRLNECLAAYKNAESRVLRVEFNAPDPSFPVIPGLVITAPNMDEKEIITEAIDIYRLYFDCMKSLTEKVIPSCMTVIGAISEAAEQQDEEPE